MTNRKGFTLIELLVVVLIIGILAAMAMPAYFKAVERSRAAEADTLIGTVIQAQQRYKMKTGKFAKKWSSLDVAPQGAPAGLVYCTKGTQATDNDTASTACTGNGFAIILSGDLATKDNKNGVEAVRVGSGQYTYKLWKRYDSNDPVHCDINGATTDDNKEFCIEYTGDEGYTGDTSTIEAQNNNA